MKPEEQLHPDNSPKLIGKKLGRKFEIKRTVGCCSKISELKIREIFNLFKRETGKLTTVVCQQFCLRLSSSF